MINKWRYVRYEDDGVSEYQCLKCKATWSSRGGFGPFCTWCGTRWEGELVWDTEERQERQIKRASWKRRPETTKWYIQSRSMWNRNGNGEWKPFIDDGTDGWKDDESQGYETSHYSAVTMSKILAEKRRFRDNDKFWRVEYRVVLRVVEERAA